MAMMPGKKPAKSGMVKNTSKAVTGSLSKGPAKHNLPANKPASNSMFKTGKPGRVAKNPLPPGQTRIKDGKGGFKVIKAKPGTAYTMSRPATKAPTRKPR